MLRDARRVQVRRTMRGFLHRARPTVKRSEQGKVLDYLSPGLRGDFTLSRRALLACGASEFAIVMEIGTSDSCL